MWGRADHPYTHKSSLNVTYIVHLMPSSGALRTDHRPTACSIYSQAWSVVYGTGSKRKIGVSCTDLARTESISTNLPKMEKRTVVSAFHESLHRSAHNTPLYRLDPVQCSANQA